MSQKLPARSSNMLLPNIPFLPNPNRINYSQLQQNNHRQKTKKEKRAEITNKIK
uniref:Uncharacterized protein n=1 Tax=Rhizophora mucronata TaxID=61149 RepID=A0A2P2PWF0_RHIMU